MLLRLPKPLNLNNSGKEKGERSVGLLLAQCDDGRSQSTWSWVGVGKGHYVAWCHSVTPTSAVSAWHDIPVICSVYDAA